MNNKQIFFISIFLILINLGLIIAPATQVTNVNTVNGLQLKIPLKDTFKVNTDYEFEVHVFNISDGKAVNSGISCYMHLYNKSGKPILELMDTTASHQFDYSFEVSGGNFTLGGHTIIFQCNTSTIGGFFEEYITVTKDGSEFIYNKELFIITLLIITIILFIIGISFNNDKWILKSTFIILSILFCIITLNGIYNFISDSNILSLMGLSGLIILITIFIFLLLYVFILWSIQTFKSVKQKEGVRWNF